MEQNTQAIAWTLKEYGLPIFLIAIFICLTIWGMIKVYNYLKFKQSLRELGDKNEIKREIKWW